MRPRRDRIIVAVALGVVAIASLTAAGALPAGQALTLTADTSGETLLSIPVEDGTTVTLAYTHSVERSPVRDGYVVRDGQLAMTHTSFESYGWGLPAEADVELVNGTFVAERHGSFAELTVKPGRLAGHRLIVGDRTVDLVALADGRSVRLAIQDRSVLAAARHHAGAR